MGRSAGPSPEADDASVTARVGKKMKPIPRFASTRRARAFRRPMTSADCFADSATVSPNPGMRDREHYRTSQPARGTWAPLSSVLARAVVGNNRSRRCAFRDIAATKMIGRYGCQEKIFRRVQLRCSRKRPRLLCTIGSGSVIHRAGRTGRLRSSPTFLPPDARARQPG